jgi:hypothetical protein
MNATRKAIWVAISLLGAGAGLVLGGCASGPDPATVSATEALNPEATYSTRLAAVERGRRDLAASPGDPATRELLKKVVWRRSNPIQLRIDAIDALVADEAASADTERMLALLVRDESAWRQWGVIEHIGDVAAARGWTSLAPGLVVSYSRQAAHPADDERAELAALEAMFPDRPVADVVFDVFAGRIDSPVELRERDRLAAWSLLSRLDPSGSRARALLADPSLVPGSDPLVAVLAESSRRLGVVPGTGEELAWARRLLGGEHDALVRRYESLVASLDAERREGLELRHLAGLLWTSDTRPQRLGATRAELVSLVEQTLEGRTRHWRTGGSAQGRQQTMRNTEQSLVWADLVLVSIAMEAIEAPALAGALFDLADRDLLDTSTEHGGVIEAYEGRLTAVGYPPRPSQRLGDRQFVASDDLLRAGTTALYHFHLHATEHTNKEYAGPSVADLQYASTFGASCLVLTFVDRDTLNADYYQPNGAVLDLGVASRP